MPPAATIDSRSNIKKYTMDALQEHKDTMMQTTQYQYGHNSSNNHSSHPSSNNRPSTSSSRRSRSTNNSQFTSPPGSTREARPRSSVKESSFSRRNPHPNAAQASGRMSSSGHSSSRSSRQPQLSNNHISMNHPQNNSIAYQSPYGQPAHHAPPQSGSHFKSADEMVNSSSNYPATSIQAPQNADQQRRPAYLLHRDLVIGKGSYGQVCIASRGEAEGHSRQGGKRKKFACKCVMLRNDPKYIAKLQEEVNVLRELRGHENVIRLYDVFCVDNELFIITELGRGGDLFHLLTTHPKHGVTEAYAAKTVAQMLSAVAYLHYRHICHRDLKLENWVLESGRDVWSPLKLIDFGLSTHYTPGHRLSRVVGSSYYVAPEVLKKSYTEACDLWSLGVIVYMLLSGAPPFYGKNDEAIKASIVNGEYNFPHELFRDVSDEAMAFISTLLSYNIEYRYTADQALTHPWLATNCDPEILQRAKDGARGIGPPASVEDRPESMQL